MQWTIIKQEHMGTMYNDTMQTAYVGSLVTILILHATYSWRQNKEENILTRFMQEGQQVSSTQLLGTWVMTCKLSLEKELKMLFFVNIHCYWNVWKIKSLSECS